MPTPDPLLDGDPGFELVDAPDPAECVGVLCDTCLKVFPARPKARTPCPGCGAVLRAPGREQVTRDAAEPAQATCAFSAAPPAASASCIRCGDRIPYQPFGTGKCRDCETFPMTQGGRERAARPDRTPWSADDLTFAGFLGLCGVGLLAVVAMLYDVVSSPSRPRKLTDDDRIERMHREQRDLQETHEWMQEKARADQWDKLNGR